jgi:hypothetical protein
VVAQMRNPWGGGRCCCATVGPQRSSGDGGAAGGVATQHARRVGRVGVRRRRGNGCDGAGEAKGSDTK